MGVLVSFQISVFILFELPRSGTARSYDNSIFNLLRNFHTVFLVAYQFTFLLAVHRVPLFLQPHRHLALLVFLVIAILTDVGWYFTMFSHAFPSWLVMLSIFSCTCYPYLCLLWKNVYSDFLPIFNWLLWVFCHWVVWVLYIFWILTPYQIYDLQIFSLTQ